MSWVGTCLYSSQEGALSWKYKLCHLPGVFGNPETPRNLDHTLADGAHEEVLGVVFFLNDKFMGSKIHGKLRG